MYKLNLTVSFNEYASVDDMTLCWYGYEFRRFWLLTFEGFLNVTTILILKLQSNKIMVRIYS